MHQIYVYQRLELLSAMIKNIPGWSVHVEDLHCDSLMWHRHWIECGQRHHGPLSGAHYHKAVIKNSDRIRTVEVAEAIADNEPFKEAFVATEIISYYNFNRSNKYTVLLDATKAFDRMNYCKLFRQLLDRNILH